MIKISINSLITGFIVIAASIFLLIGKISFGEFLIIHSIILVAINIESIFIDDSDDDDKFGVY